jgi:hypothetical protein
MRVGRVTVAVVAGLLAGRAAAADRPAARLLAPIVADAPAQQADAPSDDRPAVRFAAAVDREAYLDRSTSPRLPAPDSTSFDQRREREAFAVGDKLRDWWDRRKDRRLLQSDHAFDALVAPVTSPFLFEDPRASTEVRPLFLYQKVPDAQPNFRGGNLWFAGAQVRLALTERFSLVVSKLGAASANPDGVTPFDTGTGLAELWVGPKYTLIRDEEHGTLLAGGATFQVPAGSEAAFQDTGSLSVAPYLTLAQPFLKSRLGSFVGMANGGYSFSVNKARSDYLFANAHLSFDVGNAHRFYPLAELSYTQVTTDGRERPGVAGEGRDLINFGGRGKGGLLTGALGGRVKLTKSLDVGAAFELPLAGDKDFFGHRFTVDLIWRY